MLSLWANWLVTKFGLTSLKRYLWPVLYYYIHILQEIFLNDILKITLFSIVQWDSVEKLKFVYSDCIGVINQGCLMFMKSSCFIYYYEYYSRVIMRNRALNLSESCTGKILHWSLYT